jgi:P-type Cu2+ transporter
LAATAVSAIRDNSDIGAISAVLDDELETARFTFKVPGAAAQGLAESALRIGGMHCAACAGTVERALLAVPGVAHAQVSAASQSAAVQWHTAQTRPSAFVAAVQQAGYTALPNTHFATQRLRQQESRQALWRLFVAVFCAMQTMMMAAPAYFSAPGDLAPDLKRLMDWAAWLLTLPVMVFAAAPFFQGAWRAWRTHRIGMDVPVALGLGVAFVASTGAAFNPRGVFGADVYFDSITMFVSFLLCGRYLEMRLRHRAEVALQDTVGRLPETTQREATDGSVQTVSVLRLQRGDVLRVPLGQAFCADGVLTQGRTRADESLLTGESAPVEKGVGDSVVAGSINLGAPVAMRVQSVGADTRYEAIVALMRRARSQRPLSVMGADRWAAPFLWAVLLLALGAAAVWSVVDPSRAVWVAVSVLIVTCPCALSLAAPSALLSASSAMAQRGVLLRRMEAVEGLARMQVLFLDKTGTLTQAQTRAQSQTRVQTPNVQIASKITLQTMRDPPHALANAALTDLQLLQTAASLAAWSSHPLAKMMAAQAHTALAWRDLQETPGQGVQGRDEQGAVWCLGQRQGAAHVSGAGSVSGAAHVSGAGHVSGAVADLGAQTDSDELQTCLHRNGEVLATFHFAEALREGAAEAVRALQADGVKVTLLSGDSPTRVQHLAKLLGVHEAHGGQSPQAKLVAVRAAQALNLRVAMIGDGINDAPVLAQADVSLAMGEGAQIARAQADGVLISNSLADVVRARALAKKTMQVIRQNFWWAGLYNAACVPLALWGYLPPWAAGLGMAVSSLVVVGNSMRLGRLERLER